MPAPALSSSEAGIGAIVGSRVDRARSSQLVDHDRSETVVEMVRSAYAETIRTSLYPPAERPVQSHGDEAKGVPFATRYCFDPRGSARGPHRGGGRTADPKQVKAELHTRKRRLIRSEERRVGKECR